MIRCLQHNKETHGQDQSLQDPFECPPQGARAGCYLSGQWHQTQGTIDSFDQFVVLLKNTVNQMVYKPAISMVVPARNVRLTGADEADAETPAE